MKSCRTRLGTLLVVFGLVAALAPPAPAAETLQLSLQQAIRMAVEKNLDVRAELYNPAAAKASLQGSQGIYNPQFTLQSSYQDSITQPTSTFLSGGASVNRDKDLNAAAGATQLLPTGATVGLSLNNDWVRNNLPKDRGFRTDYWESQLTLNLSQPLLKNFGRDATEINISVARFARQGALETFKQKLLDVLAQVRNEYYKLYSVRQSLMVQQSSLKLAEKVLADTRARVKAGVLPAMELLNAEFGVATRQRDLNLAEQAVQDQEDVLRVLLQLPAGEAVFLTDVPSRAPYQVDVAAELKRALAVRPDLQAQLATLRSDELQARVARNLALPDLTLDASVAATGLHNDFSRDLEKVGAVDYPVWQVGVTLQYPLGNDAARNEAIRRRLLVGQTRVLIAALRDSIGNAVRSAVRALQTSFKQIEVTDRGRAYAEERVQAYLKKNAVGLATTKDVLDVENDLVAARNNQIQALADYATAKTRLWQVTGELLRKEGITLQEEGGDRLYRQAETRGDN